MKAKYILIVISLFLAVSFSAVPTEQNVSYGTLAANFKTPPRSSGLDCWWWWLNGNVTEEAITSDLEAMKEKGFYGAMIFDAGGYNQRGNKDVPAGPEFGSAEWRRLFVHALDEAERLGLELGFNIQSGWNLGGPFVTPEYAAKRLTYSETRLSGGEVSVLLARPETKLGFYKDVAVIAFPVDSSLVSPSPVSDLELKLGVHELGGSAPDCRFLLSNRNGTADGSALLVPSRSVLDISGHMDSEGMLKWTCPSGTWAVLRVGYTCTGAVVSTCSKGWDGLVLDYMSAGAFDLYVDRVVEPIFKDAGRHVGTTLKFLETDSWECGGMNWSDGFERRFRAENGYDLTGYLPVLAGYVVDDTDTCNAFLSDFRKTIANAVASEHYGRFAEYAHSKGLGIQPESAGPHAGPLNGIDNYSYNDIMMSEFWAPSPHRPKLSDRFFLKQASSAAHIYGRRIVGAESFTTIGPHWNDEIWHNQKPSFDHEVCAGLNRVYFHTFTCSPPEMGVPGQEYFAGTHINPRLTWWKEASAFMEYLTRVQYLAQNSDFVADVLYYYGDHVPNIYPYKHADLAGAMPGFDYDVTNEDVLLKLSVDSDGRVVAPSGLAYRVLVLPDHKVLSLEALRKVKSLLRQGATVVGPRPESMVSLRGGAKARKEFGNLVGRLWGDGSAEGVSKFGRGTLVCGMSAREYLLSTGLKEDFAVVEDPQLTGFDYIHYVAGDSDVYFISNMSDEAGDVTLRFRVSGKRPELWNAMDGTVAPLDAFTQDGGCTDVPLHFEPCGSAVVVFHGDIPAGENGTAASNHTEYSTIRTITGPWQVTFDTERGGPGTVVFDDLRDWTLSSDEGIRYYSGPAVYCKEFSFDEAVRTGDRYCLELGSVKDVGFATVRINGRDKGVVWTAPFRVDVTEDLREGDNTLEVTVVNSWYNRVAGDQLNPGSRHYTSTNIMLDHDFRGRRTETISLSPSGLLGPVVIKKSQTSCPLTVADNGSVSRTVVCSGGHVLSGGYCLVGSEDSFIDEDAPEFSFIADGTKYSGESTWKDIQSGTTVGDDGSSTVVSMKSVDGRLLVELVYTSYPGLALVRKEIRITNVGSTDVRVEAVNVEDLWFSFDCTHSQIYRSYGRFQALGSYRGDWDDPLLVVHHNGQQRGMAVGNETVGILKRSSVFEDGRSLEAGTTLPDQDYPFRRWLAPGQSWTSAPVFTAPYIGRDYQRVVNTTVQSYVRRHMGVRIEQIDHKPLFVYNTWVPFYRDIDEQLILELADAAAECGVEEFIIDDGWQNSHGSSSGQASASGSKKDWGINGEKFPHGLKPVFDHIKALGMKPGIWLSVGRLDSDSEIVRDHADWIVRDASGNLTDLHTGSSTNYTACMGTEWCDYIKDIILHNVHAYGIEYVKLDLAIVTSAYVYDAAHTGCYASGHKYHRDHEESYDVIYEQCMKMFDDLHAEAPGLFIDCTFETAGKLQLMDYGIAKHADGNWLSNVEELSPAGALRVRELGWVRSPALPATSLVIGNQRLDQPMHLLAYKSLMGTLPIMLGDPRSLSSEERAEFRAWTAWVKELEHRHGIMSFRQDLPGFGMPRVGAWDGFCRINTDTRSGGLVGVFREGSAETSRTVTVCDLDPDAVYSVRRGPDGTELARMTGRELEKKGFLVSFDDEYSGELFEVVIVSRP